WSIVLAGYWNRAIFLPPWVGEHLFGDREIETEVPFLFSLPLIYKSDDFDMEITGGRLLFRPPKALDDKGLLRAEEMARKTLELLPETPVHAVGVNFAFRESIPSEFIVEMFNDADEQALQKQEWEIAERKLTRRLHRRDDVLGLTMTFGNE